MHCACAKPTLEKVVHNLWRKPENKTLRSLESGDTCAHPGSWQVPLVICPFQILHSLSSSCCIAPTFIDITQSNYRASATQATNNVLCVFRSTAAVRVKCHSDGCQRQQLWHLYWLGRAYMCDHLAFLWILPAYSLDGEVLRA